LEFPEIVVDATGAAPVVSDALRLCADGGTVVLLGDTGFPSAQRLTGDLLRRGIRLVGVHDSHVVGRWTNATMSAFFLDSVRAGRFRVGGLVTDRFAPTEAAAAYARLTEAHAETIGVLFGWRLE
jgi:threonine dehydrogenase-like Zn-dependent dehydrogenase